jgi:hypothetical protein
VARLIYNGRAQRYALDQKLGAIDFEPVVKIFTPDGNATWLLTELDPDREYLAFGLCDCGLGEPELGFVSLHELAAARGNLGLPLEQDLHFIPTKTISAYADIAREHRRIVA